MGSSETLRVIRESLDHRARCAECGECGECAVLAALWDEWRDEWRALGIPPRQAMLF